MKLHVRWIVIAAFVLAAAGVAILALAAEAPCAQVISIVGSVQHKATQTGRWAALKSKTELRAGEWVRTGPRSNADLLILKRYRIRLDESTTIRIPHDTLAGHVHALYLSTGRIWAQVFGNGGAETRFEVETDAAVAGVRGTVFSVSHDHDTIVSVYQGRVAVSDRKREHIVILDPGTQTTVKPGRGPSPAAPIGPSERNRWNKVRGWIQKGKGPDPKSKNKENPSEEDKPDDDGETESAHDGGSNSAGKNQNEFPEGPPY